MYTGVFFDVIKFLYKCNEALALLCAVSGSRAQALYPRCLSAGLLVPCSLRVCSGPVEIEGQELGDSI